MRDDDSFLAFVLEVLGPWGRVSVKRMFGAAGLFRDGLMFGFVFDDTLYLKVGDANRDVFVAAGSAPFVYRTRTREMAMSYWEAPAAALDDEETLRLLATGAWTVARAAARPGSRRVERRTQRPSAKKPKQKRESGRK